MKNEQDKQEISESDFRLIVTEYVRQLPKPRDRDSHRIPTILLALFELWVQVPDLRLGQLFENYIMSPDRMFYQEDGTTLEHIKLKLNQFADIKTEDDEYNLKYGLRRKPGT